MVKYLPLLRLPLYHLLLLWNNSLDSKEDPKENKDIHTLESLNIYSLPIISPNCSLCHKASSLPENSTICTTLLNDLMFVRSNIINYVWWVSPWEIWLHCSWCCAISPFIINSTDILLVHWDQRIYSGKSKIGHWFGHLFQIIVV